LKKLTIKNFGPLNDCQVEIDNFSVLIGPQSSGKSTISKLVFFFLNVRESAVEFILDELDGNRNQLQFNNFTKLIRRRFIEFWGPVPNVKELYIRFDYCTNTWAEISLDSENHKYITPKFSQNIISLIKESFNDIKDLGISGGATTGLFATSNVIDKERTRSKIIELLKKHIGHLLNFDKEILFIPAGRSLLSTISDQLQYIHPHQLDYPMRQFIERINATKTFFNKSLDDIIKEKHVLEESITHKGELNKAKGIIKRILKAEYRYDKEGAKLYVGAGKFTKINFASSGQQESVWILLSLFLVLLENVNALIFIEEPEAHLFPVAQKEMINLICYVSNKKNCQFMITTHSPYILSSINNHIYSGQLGKKYPKKVSKVIPDDEWINPELVNGYFVSDGLVSALYDNDMKMLKTELVDSASDLVNIEYEKLFFIENDNNEEH